MKAKPTAIILDFDGVVADTERMYLDIWPAVGARHGVHVSADVVARTPGKPNRLIVAELFADLDPAERQQILDEVVASARKRLETELRTLPGVEEFLAGCRGRYRLALATNSSRNYVREMTSRLGLSEVFDIIVCGEGKLRPKPEPDIYLQVLRELDLPPEQCLVVEDSLVGVTAARAAGLSVIGLAGTFGYADLAELTEHVAAGWPEITAKLLP